MNTSPDAQFRRIEKAELTNIIELQREKLRNMEMQIYEGEKEIEKLREMLVETVGVSEERGTAIQEMKDVIEERDETIRLLRESATSLASDADPTSVCEAPEHIDALRTIAKLELDNRQLLQNQFDSEQQMSSERDAHSEKLHHLESANKELIAIIEQLKAQQVAPIQPEIPSGNTFETHQQKPSIEHSEQQTFSPDVPTQLKEQTSFYRESPTRTNTFKSNRSDFQRALHSEQKPTFGEPLNELLNDNSAGGGALNEDDLLRETSNARNRIQLQTMMTSSKLSIDASSKRITELSKLLKESERKRHELENQIFIANSKVETQTNLMQEVDALRTAHSTMSETTFKSLSRGVGVGDLMENLGFILQSIRELDSDILAQSQKAIQKSTSLQKLMKYQYDRTRRLLDELPHEQTDDSVATQLLNENIELTTTISNLQLRITSLLHDADKSTLLQNSLQQELQATKSILHTTDEDQPFLVFIDSLKDVITTHRQLAAEQLQRIQHQADVIVDLEQSVENVPNVPQTVTEVARCDSCFTNTVCISNLEDENTALKMRISDMENSFSALKNTHQISTPVLREVMGPVQLPQLPPVAQCDNIICVDPQAAFNNEFNDSIQHTSPTNDCQNCQQSLVFINDLQKEVDSLKASSYKLNESVGSIETNAELQKKLQSVISEKTILSEKWETLVSEHSNTMKLTRTALESKSSQIAHLRDLLKSSPSGHAMQEVDEEACDKLKNTLSQWGIHVENSDVKTLAKVVETLPVSAIRDAVNRLAECMHIPYADDASIEQVAQTIVLCKNKAKKQQNSLITEKEKRRSSISEVTSIKDRIRELEINEAASRRGSLAYSIG